MFVLFMIIILAVLALCMSNGERKQPAALIVLGLMSVILGGRAVAVLSNSYSDEYLGASYGGENNAPSDLSAGESEAVIDATSSNAEFSAGTTPRGNTTPDTASTQPRELTVEPASTFRYLTTPRPEWVETEASKHDDFYQVAVESGLHVRKRTAQQSLRDEVKATVDAYVNNYLGSELAATLAGYSIEESEIGATRKINLRLDGKTFEIARERFDEQVEFDYGVMNQSHALVKVDKKVKDALDQRWSKVRATSRLFQTGLGAGAILLLLGTMFSYLKLDTATRGYYTGRLQFGAAAVILAVIAAGVVCANRIPWM
ncbi:MAG TPA: hypothetical protein VMM76_01275 [Pirellulaceae bacterium]|nr:hypothetical protein [Pirellulaceae bacterium]